MFALRGAGSLRDSFMRAQKLAAVACACALATGVAATPLSAAPLEGVVAAAAAAHSPLTSDANLSTLDATTEAHGDATCDESEAANKTDDAASKKKGDPLVRALTAPFRALARLFGGGKKDSRSPNTAKAKDAHKSDAATVRRAGDPKRDGQKSDRGQSVNVAASNTTSDAATPPALPLPRSTASSSSAPAVATPGAAVAPQPKENEPFTPLIVGVAGDPLSQGRALLERGYVTEAIRELSIAAVTGSNLVEANNLLGLAHDLRGLHKQAQEFYERALTVAPADARVINNLGYSLYLDDRYKDALAKLKLAARLDPSRPEIFNNLGFVYGRLNKYDDALRNFARAGGDFYARVQTATLLEAAGRDLEAIKHYEAARRIDPASTEILRRLVNLYNRTGQRDKAEAAERALDRPKTKTGSSSG
jgi:Tfp pilus assembly protein PilF